jgi:hypothetical protein
MVLTPSIVYGKREREPDADIASYAYLRLSQCEHRASQPTSATRPKAPFLATVGAIVCGTGRSVMIVVVQQVLKPPAPRPATARQTPILRRS